jgi:hypothetical protein
LFFDFLYHCFFNSLLFPFFLSFSPYVFLFGWLPNSNQARPLQGTCCVFLLLMPHSIKCYSGQSPVFKLAFPKYSSVRYFRNANRLFLIGVGGFTPEHYLPASHGLPHFASVEGYKRSRDISVGIATGYWLDGRRKTFSLLHIVQPRHWLPPNLLVNGHWTLRALSRT